MSQLVLYAIYYNPKASKQTAADLEEGRQREPLLSVPENERQQGDYIIIFFLFFCII